MYKKQMSRRDFLKFAGLVGAGSLLASCKPKETPAATELTPTEAPPAAAPLKISMYYPTAVDGPLAKIFEGYAADFNKANPDVEVTAVYGGNYEEVRNKILTELKGGGETASIAIFGAVDGTTLTDMDIIYPVEDFINQDADAKTYVDDFYPGFLDNAKVKGKMVSVPFQRSVVLFFYNKDLLKGIGLDPEKAPAKYEDMAAAGQKLTNADEGVWGVEIPTDAWLLQPFAIANGQNVVEEAANKVYFNHPAVVEGLTQWQKLIFEYKIMPKGELSYGDPTKHFSAGTTAMLYNTSGQMTSILTQAQFDVGVGLCPAGTKGYGTVTGGGNLFIIKTGKPETQQAGYKFIRFLTEPERVADWTKNTGYIAHRKSAWETETLKQLVAEKPQYLGAREMLPYAKKELETHQYPEVYDTLYRAVSAVVTGEKQPQEALDQAQKDADQLLAAFTD